MNWLLNLVSENKSGSRAKDQQPYAMYSLVRQSFKFTFLKAKRLKHLHRAIDLSAQIWNHCVALHSRYYQIFGKGLSEGKLKANIAKLRNARFSHWKAVGSQSVQAIVERLYLAWAAFFKGDIKRPPTLPRTNKGIEEAIGFLKAKSDAVEGLASSLKLGRGTLIQRR
jgi:hypothetical protein